MKYTVSIILVISLFTLSCEKNKGGLIDPVYQTPYLLSSSATTALVNLDTSMTVVTPLGDNTYRISNTVNATAIDRNGENHIAQVLYYLSRPDADHYFSTGLMTLNSQRQDTLLFSATFSFIVNRTEIGAYKIEVLAQTALHQSSNTVQSSIIVTRGNTPPHLANLTIPDTLHVPNSGTTTVFFGVSATDLDGLGDIEKVFFRSINSSSPDFEQPMFDDGQTDVTGDSVANDGRFTRLIPLLPSATLGRREFRFWARDKSGTLSDSLIHFIVFIPE
jgi:hypothetical protein